MTRSRATKNDAAELPVSTIPQDTKFETALAELEQIVQDMESGRFSLEESITSYHRGSELLRHCQNQLGEAERRIRIFEDGELRDAAPDMEASR